MTTNTIHEGAGSLRTDDMDASAATVLRSYVEYAEQVQAELHNQVTYARSMGMSWSEIGAVFGISKQAAQQRFRA